MYATTTAPGCSSFHARNRSAVIESASPQPAFRSGRSTVRVGFRIFAVSAMNRTPAKTITGRSVSMALRDR